MLIIQNKEKVAGIVEAIKKGGAQNLHILSDFDRTLTYGSVDGIKTSSIISVLRSENMISDEYTEKSYALKNKYHPIEINPRIPLAERKAAMVEWWNAHHKLLIESGLKKHHLIGVAQSGKIRFRDGVVDFLNRMHEALIPVVILSASGAGDIVQLYFEEQGIDTSNVHFVTNQLIWNGDEAIGIKEPVIHSLNKDETVLKQIPKVFEKIQGRKNVILLGDGVEDLGMVEGFEYDNLLTIGFSNFEDDEDHKQELLEGFDVVIEGDVDFAAVNEIISQILG